MPKWADIKRDVGAAVLPPEEGRDEGLGLGELRAQVGMTQVELARRMNVDQPRVSRYERQNDLMLTTLRDYVRGLGGQLELLARFPDDRVIWIEPPDVGDLPSKPMATAGGGVIKHDRHGHPQMAPTRSLNRNVMEGPRRPKSPVKRG